MKHSYAAQEKRRVRREILRARIYDRRYLVPNAVTIGNMFCGFLAIMYSSTGRFEKAAIAIAFAILLDGLDGRVARKLNATSKFGVEFDSFSDLISFGVAPAVLVYFWSFWQQLRADEFGVLVTFIFAVCSASRLARFNIADPNMKSFTGLPTPGAAAAVAALINFMPRVEPTDSILALATILLLSLAYLMVSKIPFYSIKTVHIGRLKPSVTIGIAAMMGLTWYNNAVGFLVLAFGYAFSGLLQRIFSRSTPEPVLGEVISLPEKEVES